MANSNGGIALRLCSSKALAVLKQPSQRLYLYFVKISRLKLGMMPYLSDLVFQLLLLNPFRLRNWVWLLLDVPEQLPAAVQCSLSP
jgi:hypothetical protein